MDLSNGLYHYKDSDRGLLIVPRTAFLSISACYNTGLQLKQTRVKKPLGSQIRWKRVVQYWRYIIPVLLAEIFFLHNVSKSTSFFSLSTILCLSRVHFEQKKNKLLCTHVHLPEPRCTILKERVVYLGKIFWFPPPTIRHKKKNNERVNDITIY